MNSTVATRRDDATRRACTRVLTAFADTAPAGAPGIEYSIDFGPALLATLSADRQAPPQAPESRAFAAWLRQLRHGCRYPGLFGWGLAGYLTGLRAAASRWPAVAPLAARARQELAAYPGTWRTAQVAWFDYDLITGPAGTLLALAADPASTRAELSGPVDHLIGLCDDGELTGLRVGQYRGEPMRGWNHGRVNTGMAHGATGVTAALCAAAEATGRTERLTAALRRLTSWLVDEAYTTAQGLITWPHAGGGGRAAPLPQAWCYGTPSVAWTLWEAGRVLDDTGLREFALRAAESFLARYDDEANQPDLSICHGVPGLILLCDAFDRHTPLAGAGQLRDHFVRRLVDRLDAVVASAGTDSTLLSGATGACVALLTLRTGERSWLPVLGLR